VGCYPCIPWAHTAVRGRLPWQSQLVGLLSSKVCKSGRCVAAGIMETRQQRLTVAVLSLAVLRLAVLMDAECMDQDMHREMRIAYSDRAEKTGTRAHSPARIL
jgi:hypothetical protein